MANSFKQDGEQFDQTATGPSKTADSSQAKVLATANSSQPKLLAAANSSQAKVQTTANNSSRSAARYQTLKS
jgi:hypothetical protein